MAGGLKKIGQGIGNFFGGEQGEYYSPTAAPQMERAISDLLARRNSVNGNAGVTENLDNYATGKGSIKDALSSFNSLNGDERDAARDKLATDALTGSKLATQQVQDNDILGQLFGKGGSLDRANTEEQELASRGYSLKPEDYEAYGQMSDELTRQFGAQEKSLASAMARQGLSQAPSGVAAKQFSGLQGNKFEQLAALQRKVADDRMNMNMKRLSNTRDYVKSLGNQAQGAIQDQYGRNMTGVERGDKNRNTMADLEQGRNAQAIAQWKAQNQFNLASMQDKRDAYKGGALEALSTGLKSSFANIGAAPGKFASSLAGKAGGAVGGGGKYGLDGG